MPSPPPSAAAASACASSAASRELPLREFSFCASAAAFAASASAARPPASARASRRRLRRASPVTPSSALLPLVVATTPSATRHGARAAPPPPPPPPAPSLSPRPPLRHRLVIGGFGKLDRRPPRRARIRLLERLLPPPPRRACGALAFAHPRPRPPLELLRDRAHLLGRRRARELLRPASVGELLVIALGVRARRRRLAARRRRLAAELVHRPYEDLTLVGAEADRRRRAHLGRPRLRRRDIPSSIGRADARPASAAGSSSAADS